MFKKIKTILFTFFLCFTALSADAVQTHGWKVVQVNLKKEIYTFKKAEHSIAVPDRSYTPVIEEVKKHQGLIIIVYHGSTSGTFFMLEEKYGLIYNPKTKKILGDYPYKNVLISDNPENYEVERPQWQFKKDRILIKEDQDSKVKIVKIQ